MVGDDDRMKEARDDDPTEHTHTQNKAVCQASCC